MLGSVSTWFVEQGMTVGVIARSSESLARLEDVSGPGRLVPLALDYHDVIRLKHWVRHFQLMEGPLDLVVAWVHKPSTSVLEAVVEEVHAYRQMPWRLIHLVGSNEGHRPATWTPATPCYYQRVVLGFINEANGSRWLTHQEVFMGVVKAVTTGVDHLMIGTLSPWEQRPQ